MSLLVRYFSNQHLILLRYAAGALIARLRFDLSGPCGSTEQGVGPLRVWPGGLHMTRAFGDTDCGPAVIPHPNIKQVGLGLISELEVGSGGHGGRESRRRPNMCVEQCIMPQVPSQP